MNVVDSSAWLEYFAGTNRAALFAKIIENTEDLLVPSITIFEVHKKMYKEKGETKAVEAVEQMQEGKVIDVDDWTAVLASKLSVNEKLGMGDAMIYAITILHGATLWTQDIDFKDLPNVKYFAKA